MTTFKTRYRVVGCIANKKGMVKVYAKFDKTIPYGYVQKFASLLSLTNMVAIFDNKEEVDRYSNEKLIWSHGLPTEQISE